VVRESFALSSSRDAFGVSNDSDRTESSRLGLWRSSPLIQDHLSISERLGALGAFTADPNRLLIDK